MNVARPSFAIVIALAILTLGPSPARAQDAPPFFADGTAYLGLQQFDHVDTKQPFAFSDDPSGTVGGGTVGVGTFLSPHVSVRFEASFESSTDLDYPQAYPLLTALNATETLLYPLVPSLVQLLDSEQELNRRSFSVLAGYHQGRGRARIGYLAGIALVRSEERTSYSRQVVPVMASGQIAPVPFESDVRFISYQPSIALGVDVEIDVGKNIRLLPQLRTIASTGVISIRPGIGVRWVP